jgi:hypothetical protein
VAKPTPSHHIAYEDSTRTSTTVASVPWSTFAFHLSSYAYTKLFGVAQGRWPGAEKERYVTPGVIAPRFVLEENGASQKRLPKFFLYGSLCYNRTLMNIPKVWSNKLWFRSATPG